MFIVRHIKLLRPLCFSISFSFFVSIFRQNITKSNATTHHQPFNSRSDTSNVYFNLPLFQELTSQYFYCNQNNSLIIINNNINTQSNWKSDLCNVVHQNHISYASTGRQSHHNSHNAISHIIFNSIIGILFYISCYYIYLLILSDK